MMTFLNKPEEFKSYYRVVISRKDFDGSPLLEIAGFMNSSIADNFIKNVVEKHPEWDSSILQVQKMEYLLPPYVDSEDLLVSEIRKLKELNRV